MSEELRKTKRRAIEVVVFEEPGKKSRKEGKSEDASTIVEGRNIKTDDYDFKSVFEDVKSLGLTGFSKRERKKLEEQRMQSLGARKPKGQKVPYPVLQQVIKSRQEKDKNRIEMEKAMGVFTKKKKDAKGNKSKGVGGWWTDNPIKIERTSNNFNLKKADINAIKKKIHQ